MRTAFGQRVDSTRATDDDNRHTANVDALWHGLAEIAFRKHRDEVVPVGTLGVVDADPLAVDEVAADVRGSQRHGEADARDTASSRAGAALAQCQRDRVERLQVRRRERDASEASSRSPLDGQGSALSTEMHIGAPLVSVRSPRNSRNPRKP
jgi:hypothetical protein